ARALEADLCAFLLLDEPKRELVTQPGAYGVAGDEVSLQRLPLGQAGSSSVRTFLSGEPYLTGRAQEAAEPLGAWARGWKPQSLIVVPLKLEGGSTGVLRVGSLKPDRFGDDDL